MLVDDEPKAVLGFYDNCPRLGEDIIKISFSMKPSGGSHDLFIQQSALKQYQSLDHDGTGPDGEDMRLEKEAERIFHKIYAKEFHSEGGGMEEALFHAGFYHSPSGEELDDPGHNFWDYMEYHVFVRRPSTSTLYSGVVDFLVPLGGILLIVCVQNDWTELPAESVMRYRWYGDDFGGSTFNLQKAFKYFFSCNTHVLPGIPCNEEDSVDSLGAAESAGVTWGTDQHFMKWYSPTEQGDFYHYCPSMEGSGAGDVWYQQTSIVILAAQNTEENYNRAKGGPTVVHDPQAEYGQKFNEYEGFVDQASEKEIAFESDYLQLELDDIDDDTVMDTSTVKVYYRPHTKEDMQAAGLWPKSE
jgi:hypothetical protein